MYEYVGTIITGNVFRSEINVSKVSGNENDRIIMERVSNISTSYAAIRNDIYIYSLCEWAER